MGQHLDGLQWIERLPKGGGDWGKGVLGTVRDLESAIEAAEALKAQADQRLADLKTQVELDKAALNVEIKAKRKLIKATTKRAEEEAPMMFGNGQIAAAHGQPESADA